MIDASRIDSTVLDPAQAFFQDRLANPCSLVHRERLTQATCDSLSDLCTAEVTLDVLTGLVSELDHQAGGVQIANAKSLIAVNLAGLGSKADTLITVLPGRCESTTRLVDSVLESFKLTEENNACRAALEESAMQLAQSFEEQNWLRGFARNATGFTKTSSANDMADGVLKPLGFLLRALDVYLIVDNEETTRSGLCSAQFGESGFSIKTIERFLESLNFQAGSPPLVRNNLETPTLDGTIHSVVAVAVDGNSGKSFGFLVGINRSTETHQDGLPVYDPEFGSGDVGLLEEASVLLATQAHNIELLVQSNQMFLGSLHAMSNAIDARDPYTQGHSERVARLGFELAKLLSLSEPACQEIYLAGILHDIGKIGIPDAVLLKNGALSDDEFRIIQQHPEIGYRIVERMGQLKFVLPGVLHHHERFDGKGYPHGLSGESIPLMARVLAVADAFDAMTSSRPYRDAMPLEKAVGIISSGCGTQWDADIVACFRQWVRQCDPQRVENVTGAKAFIPEGSPIEEVVQAVMSLGL